MEVNLSIEALETIAEATFQQLIAKNKERWKALNLKDSKAIYSTPTYLLYISKIGHEINDLREITEKLEDIIYKFHNQIK